MKRPFLLENLVSGASQPVKFSKTTFSTARSSTVHDASVIVTPFGDVTYALVALVYSNGGHFITVGRSASGCRNGPGTAESSWHVLGASTWWCWDGLRSGGWGEGQPLDSPPLHGTQELRSGSHRWVNYQPHLFIYCRTQ